MKRLSLLLVAMLATAAGADVVVLKDGSRIAGDIKKGDSGYIVTKADGSFDVIPFDVVKSLEVVPSGGTPSAARENLASLRRSVEHDDNLFRIVGRYEQFIARTTDSAVAEQAKQDLAVWQQRKDAGLTKYGSQWVNDEQRAKLVEQDMQKADLARRQIKAEHFNEAESTIAQVLADNPRMPTALYLRGLLQYRVDQLPPARKSFEQVNQLAPNHTPTLNNLAIVLARQNQVSLSLTTFEQAMLQSPRNRQVLDNVAEALYGLPDDQRGTQIAQRVARHFTEQDVDLQKELDKQGLHRWGATWVTTAQLDMLKTAERAVKDKLDQLSTDFDAVKVHISTIDQTIGDNEHSMRNLEASSYVRDAYGNIYQATLPATYYQLQDDNNKLKHERDAGYARLEQLRTQAKQVNQDLPVPKYTGIQHLFDADSAPTVAPPGEVVQPVNPSTTKPVG